MARSLHACLFRCLYVLLIFYLTHDYNFNQIGLTNQRFCFRYNIISLPGKLPASARSVSKDINTTLQKPKMVFEIKACDIAAKLLIIVTTKLLSEKTM